MHPDFSKYHVSFDDLLSSLFAALPVNEWLIQFLVIVVVFCIFWVWRKWRRRDAD